MKTAKLFNLLRRAAAGDRIDRESDVRDAIEKKLRQSEFGDIGAEGFTHRRQANDDRPIVHRGCPND
jgi:hypothetical protein